MRPLNPNQLYQNGGNTGLLTQALRQQNMNGVTTLQAIITAAKNVATADGTVAALATALGTVETQLATPATLDKIVQKY